jgi:hypothetical protein
MNEIVEAAQPSTSEPQAAMNATDNAKSFADKPKSFLESIKPQPGDKTPCCRFAKALLKWIWNFMITQRQLIVIVAIAGLVAWGICILWGWYWTGAIVFNPSYYYALPKKELLLIIAIATLGIMVVIYALIMQHARSARLDCSMIESNMNQLDRLWLDDKQLKALREEEGREWRKEQMEKIESDVAGRIIVANTQLVSCFAERNLSPFLSKFSKEEFKMLRFLLKLLEKRGLCPSVASNFEQDYDVKQFRNCNGNKPIPVTSDGKTSYEILSSYTLLEHSINVATIIIEEIKSRTNTSSILMPKAIIIALAHDIGKIAKSPNNSAINKEEVDSVQVLDKVAVSTDHPFISGMIIQERFPNYPHIEEVVTLVQEHHVPVDKNASLYAQALKAADKKARRQEMSAWFKKHYGTDTHPDPYQVVTLDPIEPKGKTDNGNNKDKDKEKYKDTNTDSNKDEETRSPSFIQYDERGAQSPFGLPSDIQEEQIDVEKRETANKTIAQISAASRQNDINDANQIGAREIAAVKRINAKANSFGKTTTPDRIPVSEEDKRLRMIPFDLSAYERALLSAIAKMPVTINVREGVVAALDISVIPFNETLLVSFSRVLYAFRKVLPETRLDQNDFAQMAHYAIEEWRKQGIVVDIGVTYFTRKYEYYYDGRLENVSLVPFSMNGLMINAYERLELAKKHPLFNQIANMTFARK